MKTGVLAPLRRAAREFAIRNPARHGAALAYFGSFALIPVLVIGYELLTRLLAEQATAFLDALRLAVTNALGSEIVGIVQDQVAEASQRTQTGSTLATGIAVVALLYTASGAFAQLKYSLNSIWGVPHVTQLTTSRQIVIRLMGMALVLGIGLLLVVVVVASLALSSLSDWLGLGSLIPWLNALLTFILIAVLFAALYKLLPDAPVTWRGALIGAAFSALLVVAALALVALFFRYVTLNTAAMIGGGVAVILIGINYLAQIFLFGAELGRVLQGGMEDARAGIGEPS
ncbi:MAG TPA: YhjD/YihY/BrkB family envelope integrity protein [Anaerolineales bacterium]|nr:YhjD/YihY/BrkB family envelope integrity protein [Anaerolineales bacterium]